MNIFQFDFPQNPLGQESGTLFSKSPVADSFGNIALEYGNGDLILNSSLNKEDLEKTTLNYEFNSWITETNNFASFGSNWVEGINKLLMRFKLEALSQVDLERVFDKDQNSLSVLS